ncbi:hypothetical protein TIFTF001_019952 [Ficus carica]|uniref:Uncharacterized protein n=1 Tax=Ficus carica TaxID=3494 RepID=A0AA88ATH2_FICCA|nr:hypothetical protein TIFTF001_019952 [Ficus carica]
MRDGGAAAGVDAARPAADPDLRLVLGAAADRDRVPAGDGVVREGQGVPGLLRQGLYPPPRLHGPLADLLRAQSRGPRLGLDAPERRRRPLGPFLGLLSCLLLARKVRLITF